MILSLFAKGSVLHCRAVVEVGMTNDMPQLAFSLYQVFDQGEWFRSNDPPKNDPSEKYTKPVVEEIMRSLRY